MTDEVLKDAVFTESNQEETTQVQTAEPVVTAPTTEAEREDNTESVGLSKEAQEAINKRIGKKTAEVYAEREAKDAAIKKAAELEAELQALKASQAKPNVDIKPPSVDLFYEDAEKYAVEMAKYNEAIAEQAFEKRISAQKATESQRLAEQQRYENDLSLMGNIERSASDVGLDIEDVDKSAAILAKSNINPVLTDMLFQHENAAALIHHLSQNPAEFKELNTMGNPLSIIRKLDAMQSKAVQKKISNAPEPADTLKGKSAREVDDFDKQCPGANFT